MYRNKGYTLLEMLIVVMVVMIMTFLSLCFYPKGISIRLHTLMALLSQSQYESMQSQKNTRIELVNSTLYIDDQAYDLYPLVCEPAFFHYNQQGNISHALSLHCSEFTIKLQLGSGWITYE